MTPKITTAKIKPQNWLKQIPKEEKNSSQKITWELLLLLILEGHKILINSFNKYLSTDPPQV